jgi:hypothetical protein
MNKYLTPLHLQVHAMQFHIFMEDILWQPSCFRDRLIHDRAHENPQVLLTLSARHPFQNFSTPCILNVNNTGTKQGSIMK